ncbi:MAG TPA: ABC transporter substrate-binding protein [Streptosporangiaceae bacterium]|nr:ABC transporter substrate-binding protein [Streptosporangiaceae bacterium]
MTARQHQGAGPPAAARPVARRRARRGLAAGCAAAALALVAAACGSGNSPVQAGHGTPQSGGTVNWAEQPQNFPDFIFPFTPLAKFTITNINSFQALMYRPLYWFGNKEQPTLSPDLSLAYPPVYHGNQAIIKLKTNYRWSDGTPVTAQNVIFWMNMMKAEAAAANASGTIGWGGYIKGYIPDNISSYKAVGTHEVVFTIKGPFSQPWFTANELSQITPMPKAWDRTATGSSNCTAVVADCAAVYNYLNAQARDTKTYATSRIWGVVDGPWKLKSFAVDGTVVFTYNSAYGGKVPAHHITTFIERPFTTEQEEYNVLQAGGANGLQIGYLPTVDAPVRPAGAAVGENPLPGYQLAPQFAWGLSYVPFDFRNPAVAPMFNQLYIRQAMQLLTDQEGVVSGPLHGYGAVSLGPVGVVPVTKYLSPQLKKGDQFALNPGRATTLLASHGWTMVNGVRTCTRPGAGAADCGKGVKSGAQLSFSLIYDEGLSWVASAVREFASNAADVGIKINLTGASFNTVVGNIGSNTWDLLDWGGGWSYAPDYLPTGEELFGTNSVDNIGGYSNHHNDQLITETLHANSPAAFYKAFYRWENFLAAQLPNLMEPEGPNQLTETRNDLNADNGVQSPTLALTPEDWFYVK